MVGRALLRRLSNAPCEILTAGRETVDLRRQAEVEDWVASERPDAIILAAARVGGILANDSAPADFLYDNLMIEANVVEAAHRAGVERVLIVGSSCIYPKHAPQPIPEDALLTGPLEPTNEAYAIAKIAGIKLAQAYRRQHGRDYIAAMATNLYGPGDNYDPETSHVLPALMVKAREARRAGREDLEIWGSGAPLREFMHADDCADGLVFLLEHYSDARPINLGTGEEISIADLARLVMRVAGLGGALRHDRTKPDGTPRKLMDSSRIRALGWRPSIPLEAGVRAVYEAEVAAAA
jgi:GDP-L-fucose synthase